MLNVKLLRKVKKHILAEPKRFVMWALVQRKDETQLQFMSDGLGDAFVDFAPCGTAACIAGWTVLLEDGMKTKKKDSRIWSRAAKLLGLDDRWRKGEAPQTSKLFETGEWPKKLEARYNRAKTQKTRVKIAAERIDQFIKEYK